MPTEFFGRDTRTQLRGHVPVPEFAVLDVLPTFRVQPIEPYHTAPAIGVEATVRHLDAAHARVVQPSTTKVSATMNVQSHQFMSPIAALIACSVRSMCGRSWPSAAGFMNGRAEMFRVTNPSSYQTPYTAGV